jgi:SpoVK/Ycf46/Vps4 family AAA+-type ATPase
VTTSLAIGGTERAQPSSLPGRLAELNLPEGATLLIVHGATPYVTDLFVGRDLRVRELEEALWSWLRGEGFRRIVVNRREQPRYFLDSESERLMSAHPERAAAPPRRTMRHNLPGPLGNLVLKDADAMMQSVVARAAGPDGADGRRAGGQQPTVRSDGSRTALSDQGAVDVIDAAMRQQGPRTAVIFAEAEEWLRHNNAKSAFANALAHWLESPGVSGNLCVLVFRHETLAGIRRFVESETQSSYPAFEAALANLENDSGSRESGLIAIGPPGSGELSALVHRYRLLRGLAPADWQELPRIIRTMASTRSSIRVWRDRLDRLVDERRPLSPATIRELGWTAEAGTDSRSADEQMAALIGLASVKQHIAELKAYVAMRTRRAAHGTAGNRPAPRLDLAFTGNPGTGKTTVARLVGEIYREIGVLPVGHVHEARPSELIAHHVGGTRAAIESAVAKARGGILFIDEAYQLSDEKNGFGAEAVTTLMQMMDREAGQLAVVIAGYPDKIEEFLQSNPGLPRRFSEDNRIGFPDYQPDELMQILGGALTNEGLTWTPDLEIQLREIVTALYDQRTEYFGNAGDMIELANGVARRWSQRVWQRKLGPDEPAGTDDIPAKQRAYLRPTAAVPLDDILRDLDGLVGMAAPKKVIRGLAQLLELEIVRRDAGLTAETVKLPSMLFIGPPGTGKTSVAKMVGRVFHALGLLRTDYVEEATRSDLVAEYQGQTGPLTREKVRKALDGVLFIDEAYSLADGPGSGGFGAEAIAELIKQMSEHQDRLVVIAAGYPDKMRQFLQENPGLRSRFTNVEFPGYTDDELVEILRKIAAREDYVLPETAAARARNWLAAERARLGGDFGNARTVLTLMARMKEGLSARVLRLPDRNVELLRHFEPGDVPDAGR